MHELGVAICLERSFCLPTSAGYLEGPTDAKRVQLFMSNCNKASYKLECVLYGLLERVE